MPMRMRERVLNRGIPAPRDTLLLQVSQKHKRSSMFFLRFRVRCHAHESPSRQQKSNGCVPSIPSTPRVITEAESRPLGGLAGCIAHGALGRVAGAGGLVLPPDRQGAFVGQRARDVGQKKTPSMSDGDSIARRGAQRSPWRPHGNRMTHTIHTMPTAWCGWDEKTLYSARKGENVCRTAHERQNAYHRYHAYQLATRISAIRRGGNAVRSIPRAGLWKTDFWTVFGPCFGPCDLFHKEEERKQSA